MLAGRLLDGVGLLVLVDHDAVRPWGRKAFERVRLFTASAVVGRVENLYERLIAGEWTRR